MRIRTVDIGDDVADVLRHSTWASPTVLQLPPGQLDRKLYEAVNKVLTALGGKWSRKVGGHEFSTDAAGDLAEALDRGGVVDQKRTLEQFFTPPHLARRMAEALDIRCSDEVLEPSAGGGNLVAAALEMAAIVQPIELDAKLAGGLHRAMREHFGDRHCPGTLRPVMQRDFMEVPALSITPDKVLMNPPFSANQDVQHVCRALNMLRPGGKLAAIMSPHFTFANDAMSSGFRRLIGFPDGMRMGDQTGIELSGDIGIANASVELLPAGTFKEAGTNVSAVLVLIEKAC